MRVCIADEQLATSLQSLGNADGRIDEGVLFSPATVTNWQQAEDQLTDAFKLTREAALVDAPVIFLLDADAALGRTSALDSAVAIGLVSGGRCLAFEGQRRNLYATVLAADGTVSSDTIEETVRFVLRTRAALGQTIMLGAQQLGRLLP